MIVRTRPRAPARLLAAALALSIFPFAAAPAAAQGPAPLPLETPSERLARDLERSLDAQRRRQVYEGDRTLQRNLIQREIDQLRMFPRVAPPPPPPPLPPG